MFIIMSGGLLIFELLRDTPEISTDHSSTTTSAALFEPSILDVQALTNQPLFQPTRKPYIPPAKPTVMEPLPVGAELINPPTLTGIILNRVKPFALLENTEQRTSGLIELGGHFDGWTIKTIKKKMIVLSKPAQEDIVLTLDPEQLPPLPMDSQ